MSDNQPSTPPWLQSLPTDSSNGNSVATEQSSRKRSKSEPREDAAPAPEPKAEQAQPTQDAKPEAGSTSSSRHAHAEQRPEQQFRPPAPQQPQQPVQHQPQPQGPPPNQQFQPPQQHTFEPPAQQQHFQAPPQQRFEPPVQQQPQQAPPQQQPQQHRYYEEQDQRQKPEISSDGTVRHVPVQQDRVAQKYQAPPEQQGQGAPVYTWAPPPSANAPQQNRFAPPQQQPQRQAEEDPQRGGSVNDLSLLKRAKRPPRSGWRRAVHKASGGSINPGESPSDTVYRELTERVNQPVRGDYRIAVLSLKGGVGKTTTTVGLGSTFASLRGDRVIAIDANPDLGTLAHRVPQQTASTVRNLLDDPSISRYSDVRAHTSQAPSRLEVLASEQDPAVSEAFSEADYRKAVGILQSFYNIILTDCGTGLMHSAMTGVLDMASSLVLVTSQAIDGARSASATLDWLEHHGYGRLVERTVVVVNSSHRGANALELDQLRRLFLDRTRAVQVVPFDDHLAEGAEIDIELVSKPTRRALLELAAMVADDFPLAAGRHSNPE